MRKFLGKTTGKVVETVGIVLGKSPLKNKNYKVKQSAARRWGVDPGDNREKASPGVGSLHSENREMPRPFPACVNFGNGDRFPSEAG